MILIFDLMDTIIDDPFYSNFFLKLQDRQKKIWLSIKDHEMYLRFEEGKILENEYIKCSYKMDPREYKLPTIPKMKKIMFKKIEYLPGIYDVFSLINELRVNGNIKTILASNYSIWYHEVFNKKKELSTWFDFIFFSCEVGVRKPKKEFYEIINQTIERYIEKKEKIIFFDDKLENLAPIKQYNLPWETVHIKDKKDSSKIIYNEIKKIAHICNVGE